MGSLFGKLTNDYDSMFQTANVKNYARCLTKMHTDYNSQLFPKAACILDYVRASITFGAVLGLLNTLEKFVEYVENRNRSKCCVVKILCVKNLFREALKWKNVNDCSYVDIKINVLIRSDIDNDAMIIGELQFLLN